MGESASKWYFQTKAKQTNDIRETSTLESQTWTGNHGQRERNQLLLASPFPLPRFGQWLKRGIRQHRLWPQQYDPGWFTHLFGAGSSSVKWRVLYLPCLLYRLNVKSKSNRIQKWSRKHKVSQTPILSIPIMILRDSRLHSKKRRWIKCPSVRILPMVLPAHIFRSLGFMRHCCFSSGEQAPESFAYPSREPDSVNISTEF